MKSFIILGRLPGLNEYTRECRRNPYAGNAMKKETEEVVFWAIRAAKLGPVRPPVRIAFKWIERNKKRDLDNISAFGHKVIQDALVKAHILPGDGWACIVGLSDDFDVDADNPRIEVTITEVTQ